jgi:molecular chaperone DnaK
MNETNRNEEAGPIVGIDLGTTNSVVAAVIDGRVQVLVENGESLLPSVIGIDQTGKLITGVVARNQQVAFPERTVVSVKRSMGLQTKLPLGDQEFTPQEISAMILRRLRERASAQLGEPVSRAVITVPAFFDDNQRQATREAGELAGFTVERIINEPTAAALVYHAGTAERMHLVIYDFGGGTFDVSVVRMEAGVVEVLRSKGDTRLGGDDLDALLMKHVADLFEEKHGVDLRKSASTRWRLLQACEHAKCQLSTDQTVQIREEFIAEKDGSPLHLDISVSRDDYEKLILPLIDRTIGCVDEALRDAKLNINQIDDLVLVGGSTRTPLVIERLRSEFLREPSRAVDPDLAVALGAATQAAMFNGLAVGPVLVDVTAHTLGIEVLDSFDFMGQHLAFAPIIHRGTPLPARFEEAFRASHDDQKVAEIHVLQGEHEEVERNESIGTFKLDLDGAKGDRAKVLVRFELTLDGTLKVTATQPATGKTNDLKVENAMSRFQAEGREQAVTRLNELFDDSDEFSNDAEAIAAKSWQRTDRPQYKDQGAPAPNMASEENSKANKLLVKARQALTKLEGDDADDLRELIEKLEIAFADVDSEVVEELCAELDDVLFYVQ